MPKHANASAELLLVREPKTASNLQRGSTILMKANGSPDAGHSQNAPLAERLKSRVSDLQARAEKVHDRADQLHKTVERMHHDAREARETAHHINQQNQKQRTQATEQPKQYAKPKKRAS